MTMSNLTVSPLLAFPLMALRDKGETHGIFSDCWARTANQTTVINYPSLHSCVFGGSYGISVPFMVFFVIFSFYILARIAQDHFSAGASKIVEMLHMSPNTGGVTVLAFGNAAPDMFSSLATIREGNPGLGLGAIVSAGFFVTAFVVGSVALTASPFTLDPIPFIRHLCFYFFGSVIMVLMYLSGKVYFWNAAGLVFVYVVYVVSVFLMDKGACKSQVLDNFLTGRYNGVEMVGRYNEVEMVGTSDSSDSLNDNTNDSIDGLDVESGDCGQGSQQVKSYGSSKGIQHQPKSLSRVFTALYRFTLPRAKKVQMIWQVPVEVVLLSTIPAISPFKWNRLFASFNVFFCPLIFLYFIGEMGFIIPRIGGYSLCSVVFSPAFIFACIFYNYNTVPPRREVFWIAVVAAFIMSMFLISFVAGELVGCLTALCILLKLPPAFIGFTVLAWGNSVGDFMTDLAIAKAGQPAMAMAGCYAGPMFNMFVGFGFALAVEASRMHPSPYLLEYNSSIVNAFCFLFIGLLGSLSVIWWSKFQVPKFWGYCLIGLYITFVFVSICNAGIL